MRTAARKSRPGGPQKTRRAAPWIPAVIVALVLALPALWLVPRVRREPSATVDPLAGVSLTEAHERGLGLARGGDPLGAIPYFRRVVALRPDSWNAHENLAGALGNGAQQARSHLGKAEIATRSSVERVEMMRESLRETEMAESVAQSPEDRAISLFERARALQGWGYPAEALVFYRMAYANAPRPETEASLRAAQEAFMTGGQGGR